MADSRLIDQLRNNWEREKNGAATYRELAKREKNEERKAILLRIAEAEDSHALKWETRLRELGVTDFYYKPSLGERIRRWVLLNTGVDNALRQIERDEDSDIADYEAQYLSTESPEAVAKDAGDIRKEEKVHAKVLRSVGQSATPEGRLKNILHQEKWHVSASGWLGQAIYGANDGLGSVFGIVSGMAGYTGGSEVVLVAGLAATLASALSMGAGAYLATKSEREVFEAELEREREEIAEDPAEEREELSLFYQLKGFTEQEANTLAERMSQEPEQMLKTLAHEELGISESSFQSPVKGAVSAAVSTAIGGFIPIIPFFFMVGMPAVAASMVVSMAAHFGIGASKTFVTGRSWFISGLEMTIVGVLEAAVTYGLGVLLSPAH
jgi:VIT1/CCC1 family predicted Fe2+/Mn2+ transporter/rubrerythrin